MDCSAQCIVKLELTRMIVLIPATKTGRWSPGVGHGGPFATRTKKYAVKNEPNSITSEAMNRNIPSVRASTRELWGASGGGAAGAASACALKPGPPPP